jgi:hypothetical protein
VGVRGGAGAGVGVWQRPQGRRSCWPGARPPQPLPNCLSPRPRPQRRPCASQRPAAPPRPEPPGLPGGTACTHEAGPSTNSKPRTAAAAARSQSPPRARRGGGARARRRGWSQARPAPRAARPPAAFVPGRFRSDLFGSVTSSSGAGVQCGRGTVPTWARRCRVRRRRLKTAGRSLATCRHGALARRAGPPLCNCPAAFG